MCTRPNASDPACATYVVWTAERNRDRPQISDNDVGNQLRWDDSSAYGIEPHDVRCYNCLRTYVARLTVLTMIILTRLTISVFGLLQIQMLTGTLLINIPPPPSDRLWYGFRPNPQLRLKARPRVGEKAVTMSRILEWIEKRVVLEFQVNLHWFSVCFVPPPD